MPKNRSAPKIATGSLFHPKYRDRKGTLVETKTWWVRYYVPGRAEPIRESANTEDQTEAVKFLRQRMAKLGSVETEAVFVKIGQLLDMLLDEYRTKKRKSTYDVERKVEAQLRPFFGKKLASKLSTLDIKAYVAKRKADEVSNATINRELAALRRALAIGQSEDPPLVTRIPRIEKLPESGPREGTMSHEAYLAVRDGLPDYARLALVISYHTGARRGEILSIQRKDVDLKAGRIHLPGRITKNGKARYLPIYGDMEVEIRRAIDAGSSKCPHLVQRDGMPVGDFDKSWETACTIAGVAHTLFHDLRRTALTNMINAGLSEREAMEISGHRTRHVFDRYHIVSDKRMKLNAEKMSGFLSAMEQEAKKKQEEQASLSKAN